MDDTSLVPWVPAAFCVRGWAILVGLFGSMCLCPARWHRVGSKGRSIDVVCVFVPDAGSGSAYTIGDGEQRARMFQKHPKTHK